jgi:hypothetical protein
LIYWQALRDYLAIRSLASDVPIELKVEITWLAEVSMMKLPALLAQYCRMLEVGSPPVFTG